MRRLTGRFGAFGIAVAIAFAVPCGAKERPRLDASSGPHLGAGLRAERWQVRAVDAPQPRFLAEFLTPRLSARLNSVAPAVRSAAVALGRAGDSRALGWDDSIRDQARRGSAKALRGAVKNWLLDQVVFDRISLPLGTGASRGAEQPRLRLGVSHQLPRIGVAWTTRAGELDWDVDARGDLALGFAMSGYSTLRFRAEASPRGNSAAVLFLSAF